MNYDDIEVGGVAFSLIFRVMEGEGGTGLHPELLVSDNLDADEFDVANCLITVANILTGGVVHSLISTGLSAAVAEKTDMDEELSKLLSEDDDND